MEIIIGIVIFPPFIDSIIPIYKNIEQIFIGLCFFQVAKLSLSLELMHHYSPLNTKKGRFVGSLSKVEITTSFLAKSWIKSHPVIALPASISVFIFICSYVLYVTERTASIAPCYTNS